MNMKQNKWD